MERYFRLMQYPEETWIDVVAARVTKATEAWLNGETQHIKTGAKPYWATWAQSLQELVTAFEPMAKTKIARR